MYLYKYKLNQWCFAVYSVWSGTNGYTATILQGMLGARNLGMKDWRSTQALLSLCGAAAEHDRNRVVSESNVSKWSGFAEPSGRIRDFRAASGKATTTRHGLDLLLDWIPHKKNAIRCGMWTSNDSRTDRCTWTNRRQSKTKRLRSSWCAVPHAPGMTTSCWLFGFWAHIRAFALRGKQRVACVSVLIKSPEFARITAMISSKTVQYHDL